MDNILRELEINCREFEKMTETNAASIKLIANVDTVMNFVDSARKEGLLALEEKAENLDYEDVCEEFFGNEVMLIVDGTERDLVLEIGLNRIVTSEASAAEKIGMLIFLRGAMLIQEGANKRVIEFVMKSMLPERTRKFMEEMEAQNAAYGPSELDIQRMNLNAFVSNDRLVDENHFGIINQLADALVDMCDGDVKTLLSKVTEGSVNLAMKGLPGKARKRILDNVSERTAFDMVDDTEMMGPVRMRDVEEECLRIAEVIIKLCEGGMVVFKPDEILQTVVSLYVRFRDRREEERKRILTSEELFNYLPFD